MSLRHEFANTPGGLILRLLQNRNLDTTAAAYYLGGLGGRPMYSSSTIYRIAIGSKARTPDLLAGFSTVLDLTSADLAALTGVDPSAASVQVRSEAEGAADLIWSPRRLTTEQMRLVLDRAHDIRHEQAEEVLPQHRCRCAERT